MRRRSGGSRRRVRRFRGQREFSGRRSRRPQRGMATPDDRKEARQDTLVLMLVATVIWLAGLMISGSCS